MRPAATFEHAHLGMVTTATEQAWGFNAEISNSLPVVIHDAEAILLQESLIVLLYFLQKGRGERKKKKVLDSI